MIRILIDLDGVLNTYKGNYKSDYIPKIKDGAKEFIKELSQNAELYLFTTRNIQLARNWLKKYDLDKYFKGITNVKISCYLIIDDRAICFEGNYFETIHKIRKFQVHWENKRP